MQIRRAFIQWMLAFFAALMSASIITFFSQNNIISVGIIFVAGAGLLYVLSHAWYSPLSIFVGSSFLFMLIGSKLIIHPVDGYFGGVGAGSFYIGVPHIILVLGIFSVAIYRSRTRSSALIRNPIKHDINKRLLLFIGFVLVSALISPYAAASLPQLNLYLSLASVYLFWVYSFKRMEREKIVRLLIGFFTLAATIEMILVGLQIWQGQLGLNFLGEGTVEERAGVSIPSVTGTFIHPGPLSLFFCICMSILFPFILQSRNKMAIIGFTLSSVGMIMTFSRTSMVMMIPILLLEVMFLRFGGIKLSKLKVFLMSAVAAIILAFFSGMIQDRFDNLQSDSSDEQFDNRFTHFSMAWTYIKKEPVLGYGLSSWSYVTHKLQLPSAIGISHTFFYDNPVHNIYLYLWFEGGLCLLLMFLLFVGHTMYRLVKLIRRGNTLECGLFAALLCILVYGMTGWGLFNGSQLLYLMFLLMAISESLYRVAYQSKPKVEITGGYKDEEDRDFRHYGIQKQGRGRTRDYGSGRHSYGK
ncbi:O-antigen ligase family protein [Cohnella fermenti]|uniref:O-antigen ligase family protein n=1 Tax=Cohnella fermenti TaxID=2565925 RepID=A0A4S4BJ74_9BACL|nr:O-antigen ligase family protein [Cohnella fermenti]THF74695.1 O-antigen ligase family protein [Cohnella fermenti]